MNTSRLPDAELEIMKIIWRYDGEVTSAQIVQALAGKRDWAVTTVLNFLARLVEREFISVRRNGKSNIYKCIVKENDYLKSESKSFLERLHGNSLTGLIASLYDGKAISRNDLEELQHFINTRSDEQ